MLAQGGQQVLLAQARVDERRLRHAGLVVGEQRATSTDRVASLARVTRSPEPHVGEQVPRVASARTRTAAGT